MKKQLIYFFVTLSAVLALSGNFAVAEDTNAKAWSYVCKWNKLNSFTDELGVARTHNEKKRVRVELDFNQQSLRLTDLIKSENFEASGDVRKIPTPGAAALYADVALSNNDKEKILSIFTSELQRRLTPSLSTDAVTLKRIKLLQMRETVEDFSLTVYADIKTKSGNILKERPVAGLDCYDYLP